MSRVWALSASAVTALLAIAINVATEHVRSVPAWLAVAALTVGVGLIADAMASRQAAPPAAPENPPTIGNYGKARQVFQAGTIGSVRTGVGGPTVIGIVLVVAAAVTGAWVIRDRGSAAVPAEPLTVSADRQNGSCSTWVTTQSRAAIEAALPVPQDLVQNGDWDEWAPVADGAAGSGEIAPGAFDSDSVTFTVQGTSAQAVTLTRLAVRVTARRPPIRGVSLAHECGDPGAYQWFTVDLDTSPATVSIHGYPESVDSPTEHRVPLKLPYVVSVERPETFLVEALTLKCDCDWVIDLRWTSGAESGVRTITDADGRPFRTSSTANATACTISYDLLRC